MSLKNEKRIKNSQPQTKFTGSYKKQSVNDVNDKLRIDSAQVMERFNENYVDKCHSLCLGKDTKNTKFYFDGNDNVIANKKEMSYYHK